MTNREYKAIWGLGYNFTSQIQADIFLPYVVNERLESINNNFYIGRGLGDLLVRGKYYPICPSCDSWDPYVELTGIFPTGDADKDFFNRRTGRRAFMQSFTQPGSGVYSVGFGAGIEKRFGDLGLFFNFRYIYTFGANKAGYSPGNPYYATLGANYVAHRFSEGKDCALIGATFNVNWLFVDFRETRINAITGHEDVVGNTGGMFLRLEPGVFFSPDGGNFTLELTVPFPVYYNVHELQTLEKFGVNFTTSYRF